MAGVEPLSRKLTGDLPERVVYCAVTVDGDLRLGSLEQQKMGVHAMRQAHADLGILGAASWLINEHDFCWTELHPELLHELAESGECIGLHDHLDTQYLEDKAAEKIHAFLCSSRRRLNDFFRHSGTDVPISVHRNGCAHQGLEIYRALASMEYTILSDVWPEMKWHSRMVPAEDPLQPWKSLDNKEDPRFITTDNSQVPLGAVPWRHDAHNWLDVNSRSGRFLQAPITCLPWVDPGRVKSAVDNSGRQSFVVIDTHPYNLQNPATGEVSEDRVQDYCKSIEWIKETYGAVFVRLDQIPGLIDSGSE